MYLSTLLFFSCFRYVDPFWDTVLIPSIKLSDLSVMGTIEREPTQPLPSSLGAHAAVEQNSNSASPVPMSTRVYARVSGVLWEAVI